MVKRLVERIRRWQVVDAPLTWLAGPLRALPDDESGTYTSTVGTQMPPRHQPPSSIAPATVEMRFMKLHSEGRFGEMWEMLAEDAQRAWGSREVFIREMPRLDEWLEILDLSVVSAAVLESWTDHVHQRTYNNVARLVMRYRVRQQWKEWSFDRQVHLVPEAGSWGTLCYPTRESRVAAGR